MFQIDEDEFLMEKNKTSSIHSNDLEPSLMMSNGSSAQFHNRFSADVGSLGTDVASQRTSVISVASSTSSSASLNSQLSNHHNHDLTGSSSAPLKAPNGKPSLPPNINRQLPAKAIVIQQRIPNAYDKKALKLEVCLPIIKVLLRSRFIFYS